MMLVRIVLSALAYVVIVLDTIISGAVGTLLGFIPPRGDWTVRAARVWARIALTSAGIRVRYEGAELVPRGEPVVFMANHESWVDIPALMMAIPVQVRFLAKKSLFSVPFMGWAMAAMGFIPVDRANRRTAVASFEEAAARIRTGRSVLLFPEETRTPDGNLLPFQRGGFLIALKAGVPIVPVGLEGPRRCLPKHSYLVRPGTVTVRFGDAIPTAALGVAAKGALMEQTRAAIKTLRGNTPASAAVKT